MKMHIRFSRENMLVRLTAVWKYVFRLPSFAVSLSLTLIIIFIFMSIFILAGIGQFLMIDFQAFLFWGMSLLTFVSFRLLLITSLHVFLGRPVRALLLTLKVLHLQDQLQDSLPFILDYHSSAVFYPVILNVYLLV